MPDISMCLDDECPVRSTCYRHAESGTQPNPTCQTYSNFRHQDEHGCGSYWLTRAAEAAG